MSRFLNPKIILILCCCALVNAAGQGNGIDDPQLSGQVDKFFSHLSPNPNDRVQKNIGNEIIYQIVVDRFANGNHDNDCQYGGRFCQNGSSSDWYRYAGGDIRGIINNLGYLKAMGVTRLWITPIFENQNVIVQRNKYGSDVDITSYHGYWVKDWFRLNSAFTDKGNQDFAIVNELIGKAKPQLRIYLDTVANHTNPVDATEASLNFLNSLQPLAYPASHRGVLFREGRYLTSYDEDVYRSKQSNYGPMFHHNRPIGGCQGCDWEWQDAYHLENYSLDGLADLAQENPNLQNYLRDAHNFWLNEFPDLAGYRVDTIKHVPEWYWEKFSQELYGSHPNVEAFGEYYGGGPTNKDSYSFYRNTKLSMLDFNFRDTMRSIFKDDASFAMLSDLWSQDGNIGDAHPLITWLDSHDVARLRGEGVSAARMRVAIALWLVARGVPCIYYGMEQDLFTEGEHGKDGDPYNRPMMQKFDQGNPTFVMMQRLIQLRKENQALRYGSTHVVHETSNIIGFERNLDNGQGVFFAASKNPRAGNDAFTMVGLHLPDGTYKDILSGLVYQIRGGNVDVSMKNGDVIVLSTSEHGNQNP